MTGAGSRFDAAVAAFDAANAEDPNRAVDDGRAQPKELVYARVAGGILDRVGYDAGAIARVQALLRKERLKQDAEAQMIEDVACLVFLENDLAAFADGHPDDKVVDILRKTWKKMSPGGRAAALALDLPPAARALVETALGDEGSG